jgi:hypothetical protein
MDTVNTLVKLEHGTPRIRSVMIMCPVDDTGKYSVRPSTMAIMMDSKIVMADQEDFPFFMIA